MAGSVRFKTEKIKKLTISTIMFFFKTPLILKQDGDEIIQVPANIAGRLRDYQIDGVKFMFKHWEEGFYSHF